ncbi:E3 ubiquitin-protein transferase MAEA-like isoform X2 [Littorina saxatilis]|uniref:E3 ubiquitin-protein transferase MAEA n=1 Tax=Littorina saxatilis TaxID=31220 RepID=A0AAN9BQR3_9CAEN
MADLKSLEHSTLKVPYEVLNKRFRSAQKSIDKEAARVQSTGNDLEKSLQRPVTAGEVSSVLGTMVEHLSLLKRKADETIQSEMDATRSIKRRVEHLQEVEAQNEKHLPLWQKTRLDRMLVEYFLRAGYYNTAIRLAQHSNIEDLTNVELFMTSREVEESLKRKETAACLAWCYENRSKLRKFKSTLEFNIRKQEFVELIRNGSGLEAVKHARKYFNGVEEEQFPEVQKVMGLLAFTADTDIAEYQALFSEARWDELVQQFRQENFRLHQLNSSVFTAALQAGLSSLKTPHCYKDEPLHRNSNCPVCSRHLNDLAQPLPYSHCANSRLICTISGHSLNEHNPPMMLPNGNIYGLSALTKIASDNDNQVVCPRTRQVFSLDEAEKVFVM